MKLLKPFKIIWRAIDPTCFWIAFIFVYIPLIFYQFSQSIDPSKTLLVRFDIVTVSGILGGLVMTVATSGKIRRQDRRRYLRVAIAFLLATVLLVIGAVNLSWVDVQKGIDINRVDWSGAGFVRFYSFWIAVIGFYFGLFIFAYALIDLLFALWYTASGHGGHRFRR